jgi:acarbose 7IV-phosphotransferase
MRAVIIGGVSWNRIIHLDRLPDPAPRTIHARRTYEALGGTGAGKSWNLAALGWEVDLVAALGDDHAGDLAREAVAGLGVRFHAIDDPAGTEQHTNLMAPDGRRISIYTTASSGDVPLDEGSIVDLAVGADLVCVNILGHCRRVLAPLREAGVRLWTDVHDYDGIDPYHRAFVEAASAVQVSSDRLPDWRQWADARLAAGADVVVVTHGRAGADANDGSGWRHAPADRVDAVDTNGAGDAFFAGFVTARTGGADLDRAVAAGAEAAARSVQSEGLGPSF